MGGGCESIYPITKPLVDLTGKFFEFFDFLIVKLVNSVGFNQIAHAYGWSLLFSLLTIFLFWTIIIYVYLSLKHFVKQTPK